MANTIDLSRSANVAVDARADVNGGAAKDAQVLAHGGQRGGNCVPPRVLRRSELPTAAQLLAVWWALEVLVTPGLFGMVRA